MDDKEFQVFCGELKKETPDMAIIKTGMQKYGTGALSDAQKAEFLKKMFPENSISNKDRGFQNITGIRNVLSAMQQLHAEGKIGDEQMKSFLTETNPKGGANVVTTLALNARAAESKLSAKKNGHPVIKDTEARKALSQNLDAINGTLKILAKTDAEILTEVLQTPDKTSKQGSFDDYAQKSPSLQTFRRSLPTKESSSSEAATIVAATQENPLTIEPQQEEQPVQIGGMENSDKPLTISAKPKPLNIQAKPSPDENEDEEEKKIANLKDSKGDLAHGKGTFDFEPIKEQDIIQYMYNAWFLGSMNAIMKWVFKKADQGVDALVSHFNSGSSTMPVATAAPQQTTPVQTTNANPQNQTSAADNSDDKYPFLRQLDRLSNDTAQYYESTFHLDDMAKNPDSVQYIKDLTTDIKNNINKEPEQWNAKVLDAGKDQPFMEQLSAIYASDPREFDARIAQLSKAPKQLNPEYMNKLVRVCAHLATIDYAVKNLGTDLDNNENAAKFVMKKTFEKMTDMQKAVMQAQKQTEISYRKEKGIDPQAPLSATDRKDIETRTAEQLVDNLGNISLKSAMLKSFMNQHYLTQAPEKKELLAQEIKRQHQDLMKLQGKYFKADEDRGQTDEPKVDLPNPAKKQKKVGFKEAAQDDVRAQDTERKWMNAANADRAEIDAKRENNNSRKRQLDKIKKKSRTASRDRSSGPRPTSTHGPRE